MLVIESTDLVWNSKEKSFRAYASDLEAQYQIRRLDYENGQWFLHIRSNRTGKLAKFIRWCELKDGTGDLVDVKFWNEEHDLELRIIND